jgi:hypothetical protein
MSSKNSAFNKLPQFIWGEATSDTSEDGFDAYEYLLHTRYPRFACRVAERSDLAESGTMETTLNSAVGFVPNTTRELYACTTHGLAFSDFAWIDPRPEPDVLKEACDKAVLNRLIRDDNMGLNNDDD